MEQDNRRRNVAKEQPDIGVNETNEIKFEDVFDLHEIQAIQDAFAQATGVASIITDTNGEPITEPSNFCHLCIDIIRGAEKGEANCMQSDAALGRPNPDGPIIRPCLSGGLYDGGTSIYVGDQHIANWLIGQIRTDDVDDEQLMAYAEEIDADKEEFREALAGVTEMPLEQFEQIGQALYLLAQQLSKMAYQQYRLEQSERELKRSQRFLHQVINTIPDLIYVKDAEGRYLLANRAVTDRFGTTPEQIEGKTEADFGLSEELVRQFLKTNREVRTTLEPDIMPEHTVFDPMTQQERWYRTMILPIMNEEGTADEVVGVSTDITAIKEAEEERERLQAEIIEAQQRAIQELSTPVIPVMDRIIVMPLVGSIDTMRAKDIMRTLLKGIREHKAKIVILDITGVPIMDSGVANHLNKTIQAARLKGAHTIVTGVSDAVAETIIDLGIDWDQVETLGDLQTGLLYALHRLGIRLTRM
jgi:PAS domain S-box-containing protein